MKRYEITASEIREILRGLGWSRERLGRALCRSVDTVNKWCLYGTRSRTVQRRLRDLLARARAGRGGSTLPAA